MTPTTAYPEVLDIELDDLYELDERLVPGDMRAPQMADTTYCGTSSGCSDVDCSCQFTCTGLTGRPCAC